MVMHWPKGIRAKGGIRSQFTHVTDVAPTVLEAAGLPFPKSVNGTEQLPFNGKSFLFAFDASNAPDRHTTQYFEIFGNRAIYHEGWMVATRHRIPWLQLERRPFKDDEWELYNVDEDFSQANNLAASNPRKLKELQEIFYREAVANHVFPLDDRRIERAIPEVAGRPSLMGQRTSMTVYEGMTAMMENGFIDIKNKSATIVSEVERPDSRANGVIIAQGGRFGGWALYMKDGRIHHEYNFFDVERTRISSTAPLAAGKRQIKYEFVIDEAKPGVGGKSILYVDGIKVAEGRIPRTVPLGFSLDEGTDVGMDNETTVSDDYPERDNKFPGKIHKVTVDISPKGIALDDPGRRGRRCWRWSSGRPTPRPARAWSCVPSAATTSRRRTRRAVRPR